MGKTLFPLFDLKEMVPAIYESEIKKYDDHPKRKELPFKRIGRLGCVRGEVLHFSSIHPALVYRALKTIFPEMNRSVKFFKIPVDRIGTNPAVLFDMNRPEYEFGEEDPDEIFDIIDLNAYQEIRNVPSAVFEFFREWHDRGEKSAPAWGRVPHIFVKGPIDIDGCEIIDWSDLR